GMRYLASTKTPFTVLLLQASVYSLLYARIAVKKFGRDHNWRHSGDLRIEYDSGLVSADHFDRAARERLGRRFQIGYLNGERMRTRARMRGSPEMQTFFGLDHGEQGQRVVDERDAGDRCARRRVGIGECHLRTQHFGGALCDLERLMHNRAD